MSSKDAARNAISSFRIDGELVERADGGISVRRGGSVFEVLRDDILEVQELEGKKVRVTVKSDAKLTRTTLHRAEYLGSAIGWRPIFDDCTECSDCFECSVCADCTECSVCADCTECSVCADCVNECSVCIDPTECSTLGGGNIFSRGGAQSQWIRRMSGGVNRMFRRGGRRR
jgi:hypothetical protein